MSVYQRHVTCLFECMGECLNLRDCGYTKDGQPIIEIAEFEQTGHDEEGYIYLVFDDGRWVWEEGLEDAFTRVRGIGFRNMLIAFINQNDPQKEEWWPKQ